MIPLHEQIKEAERELAMRRGLYPGWVAKGTLKQADADHRLKAQEGILASLRMLHSIACWCVDNQPMPRGYEGKQEELFV